MIFNKDTIQYFIEEHTCPDCEGHGEVRVEYATDDYEDTSCRECNNGYVAYV